jgi:hypothetical protein
LAGQQTVKLKNTLEKRAFQLSTTDKGWTCGILSHKTISYGRVHKKYGRVHNLWSYRCISSLQI